MSDTDKTILIVDDEAELLEMVRAIFTRAGYSRVRTAGSGPRPWPSARQGSRTS